MSMATPAESVSGVGVATPDDTSQLELEAFSRWDGEPENEYLLPPSDGGKDAWLFLGAAFALEIMVWGKYTLINYVSVPSTLGRRFN